VNAIKNGQEERDSTSHATWNKWNLSLNVYAVFNAWQLLQKLESFQQVFTISSPTAWQKWKVCAKQIPCVLSNDRRAMCVLATNHLQHWRNEGSAFLDRIWMVESWIHSFNPWLKQQQYWMACLNVTKEENCMAQLGCSESHARHVLQPKWTCAWPSYASWYDSPWPNFCALLQDKVRLAVRRKQPELLEHGIILLQDNDRIIAIMICKTGAERCWHILPAFQISPHMITGCLHMWKNIFGVKNLNQKTMSTLLLLPPYIIWARMNTELQFNIYHIDGKSVWTVLVITLCTGHV